MNNQFPPRNLLATIAASTDPGQPLESRFKEALELWRGAGVFLRREQAILAHEIQRCNAETARLSKEAQEFEKDPFRLLELASGDVITADSFLKAVLPSVMTLPPQYIENPNEPDGPMVEKLRKMQWRKADRDKALRAWVLGTHPVYPDGDTEKEPEWRPNYEPDAKADLRAYLTRGIPVEEAIGIADAFQTTAVITRELDREAARAKGAAATKAKFAATKRNRDPKRKPTKHERVTKRAKKAADKKNNKR